MAESDRDRAQGRTGLSDEPAVTETPAPSPGASPRRWWPWVAVISALVIVGAIVFSSVIRGFFFPSTFQGRAGNETGNGTGPQAVGTSGQAAAAGGRGGRGGRGGGPVPVTVARAHVGDMPVYLNGLGNVIASETVTVRTRVDGQLIKVGFQEGQLVREGEILAEIDPRPFLVQVAQAQGQAAKDEAALKNAQLDLQRYRALLAQDAVARQQVDTQAATVNQLEGTLKSDQATIDAAKLNLSYTRMTAPFTGRVGLRQVDPGNMIHASDQNGIVVLTRVRPIAVVFTLAADTLPQVQRGLRGNRKLAVEAWDRDLTARIATGSLLSTDNEIDPNTGTFRLKAVFSNEHDELFPNQFVNARLLVDTVRGAVIVPTAAIQRSPDGTYVWVVGGDDTVQMRPCDVGLTEGEQSSIARGVSQGDTVVTDGVDRLQPGSHVQAQMADASGWRGDPGGRGGRGGAAPRQTSPVRPRTPSGVATQPGGGVR